MIKARRMKCAGRTGEAKGIQGFDLKERDHLAKPWHRWKII
jgi:hypothetical protein